MADNEWKSERKKKKKWEIAKNFYKIYFGIDVIGVLIILIVIVVIIQVLALATVNINNNINYNTTILVQVLILVLKVLKSVSTIMIKKLKKNGKKMTT